MNKINNNKGITLVELLLALGLFSALLPVLFFMFTSTDHLYNKQQFDADLHYSWRCSLYWIIKDLKESQRFELLNGGEKLLIYGVYENVQYYVENQNLYRDGNSKMPVAENIIRVNYKRLSPELVEVTLTGNFRGEELFLMARCSIRSPN